MIQPPPLYCILSVIQTTAVALAHFLLFSPLQKVCAKKRKRNPWAWLKLQNLIKSVPSTHPWHWIKSVLMWSFLPMHKFSSHCNQIKNLTAQVVREDVLPGILLSTFFKQIYIAPLLIIWWKWVCERKHAYKWEISVWIGAVWHNVRWSTSMAWWEGEDVLTLISGDMLHFKWIYRKTENVFEPNFFLVAVHYRGWI